MPLDPRSANARTADRRPTMTQITDPARLAVVRAFIEGREHQPVGDGHERLACWRAEQRLLLGTGDGQMLYAGTPAGALVVRAEGDPVTVALLQSLADGEWDPPRGSYPHATLVRTDDALL